MVVGILGYSCRVPGASNVAAFREILNNEHCTIAEVGASRFEVGRFLHDRLTEPGYAYTFAAGLIDDPLGFDHGYFGISPREVAQIDPQQRILLEVTHQAIADAGLAPSSLAGTNTGVFVAASMLDYGNRHTNDGAAIEAHFMTGNSMSILANRISYIFDLHGPSLTIDTACSSGLVALDGACRAIAAGTVDLAVVAGVNLILSAAPFVGFSRAGMLSPSGRCHSFSAAADGYVRSEGAIAFLVGSADAARRLGIDPRAIVVATGVNSDGRTAGISLPSLSGQQKLLEQIYGAGGVDPDCLAFIEAHGTGTRAGDPIEAEAIGSVIGRRRRGKLPIGSVKSNIGHLEPASGLAGLMKAVLSLEAKRFPASLNLDNPNPDIPFADLGLAPAARSVDLSGLEGPLHGAVSSFGFGGTNAHAVIREPQPNERVPQGESPAGSETPLYLMLSAASENALRDVARQAAFLLVEAPRADMRAAAAMNHRRDLMGHRLLVPWRGSEETAATLLRYGAGEASAELETAISFRRNASTAFVYVGNGTQHAGMGRRAFANNAAFRSKFRQVDASFAKFSGWSLVEALQAADGAERISRASYAQPLIFAIQSAMTDALAEAGVKPDLVLGHSVGEIAAAEAIGALSLADAVRLVYQRSEKQEKAFDQGQMAALALGIDEAGEFCRAIEGPIEIAAINAPSSVTLSGSARAIAEATALAKQRRIAARVLDIRYPFHSVVLDPIRQSFLDDIGLLQSQNATVPFISSVTGGLLEGRRLDSGYWWSNLREPVQFRAAVETAAAAGARVFIEIGAKSILTGPILDTLREGGIGAEVVGSLLGEERGEALDPVLATAARAIAKGARHDPYRMFGTAPSGRIDLPAYPWQHERVTMAASGEKVDTFGDFPTHPLLGNPFVSDGSEWRSFLDPSVVPYLTDHRVDGEAVMPAAGLVEMAIAIGRSVYGDGNLRVQDFDILLPLTLSDTGMQETRATIAMANGSVEIKSRRRLSKDDWTVHARGRVTASNSAPARLPEPEGPLRHTTADELYEIATSAGLGYGARFRLARHARRDDHIIEVDIGPSPGGEGRFSLPQVIHPAVLDAAFHGLFCVYKPPKPGEKKAFLPVRIGRLSIAAAPSTVARARIAVDWDTDQTLSARICLLDGAGQAVVSMEDVLFRSVILSSIDQGDVIFRLAEQPIITGPERSRLANRAAELLSGMTADETDEQVLFDAFALSLIQRTMRPIWNGATASVDHLVARQCIAPASGQLAARLLEVLHANTLAEESEFQWQLTARAALPPPGKILRTLMADYPHCVTEAAIAATLLDRLEGQLRHGAHHNIRAVLREHLDGRSLLYRDALRDLPTVISALLAEHGCPLRLLVAQPSGGGILQVLAPLLTQGGLEICVSGSDALALDHLRALSQGMTGVSFVLASDLPTGDFDVALAIAGPAPYFQHDELARQLFRALSEGGVLVSFHPAERAFTQLVLAALDETPATALATSLPEPILPAVAHTRRVLFDQKATAVRQISRADGQWLVATRPVVGQAENAGRDFVVLALSSATPLVDALQARGHRARAGTSLRDIVMPTGRPIPEIILVLEDNGLPPRRVLEQAVFDMVDFARRSSEAEIAARLWLVTRSALGEADQTTDATAYALRSFSRVVANEFSSLKICAIDVEGDKLEPFAHALAQTIDRDDGETEIVLRAAGRRNMRVIRGLPRIDPATSRAQAASLAFRRRGSFESFAWQPKARAVPGSGEVEIEIKAAGLNFRDVMFALGALPEEILRGGFAGPAVGFECAGIVSAIGADVKGLVVGDRVMAFASGAFATHATVPATVVTRVPGEVPFEAAATLPVAFLTAWFALVTKADIRRGEWVLIHGAAGAVGLAAIQIAKLRGARVAATAGSADKRAFVKLAGADRVYDSRSLAFADEVVRDLGGVDVVLNSLAGEAMAASLKTLRAFGRFVELGKRDFVDNTQIGLRPFRQNLSYYGVDVDQLLVRDPKEGARIMRQVMARLGNGKLRLLPYSVFQSHEVAAAFRLMQAAGHIGKIVIRPPRTLPVEAEKQAFRCSSTGVHLVVGGLAGFGFETALWLAEQGARTIVAASRQGRIGDDLLPRVEALRAKGLTFIAEKADATDIGALSAMVARVEEQHGRIAGVFHTAVVLDDSLLGSMTSEQLDRVLAPKVTGADNLDRIFEHRALDYFVAYSSVSALIGNPGQGAYVAANAYMEGVVRRRRQRGQKALAVAWGRILDTGLLTRDRELDAKVSRLLGSKGLKYRDALAMLAQIMARMDDLGADGTVICAPLHTSAAARALAIVNSPTFSTVYRSDGDAEVIEATDLRDMLADKSDADARDILGGLIAEQVARILRLSVNEIDMGRPLSELGLDSLMALELRMQIGNQLGVELPLVAISAGKSLSELAARLVMTLRADAGPETAGKDHFLDRADIQTLLLQHADEEIDAAGLDALVARARTEGAPASLETVDQGQ